jgi:hypothetical protein
MHLVLSHPWGCDGSQRRDGLIRHFQVHDTLDVFLIMLIVASVVINQAHGKVDEKMDECQED